MIPSKYNARQQKQVLKKLAKSIITSEKILNDYQAQFRKFYILTKEEHHGDIRKYYKKMENEMLDSLLKLRFDTSQLKKKIQEAEKRVI